ncbi:OsmC family protein [Vogesella indigofera]|uniref:OsmC family protein n=1 Tax=Vogesella indigofera TaxID=45465 RepID=UPI00234E7D13|nr:OsmC family protein [Vogesella indigofera]MDC7712453.1 OsmC family protein [Vogesella indigofera]
MSEQQQEIVRLTQVDNYRFDNRFEGGDYQLLTDEPAPLGDNSGPSPSQLLVAAAANCLCASLLFSSRKYHLDVAPLSCEAVATIGRNERKRLRVTRIDVTLQCGKPLQGQPNLERLLSSFEDFCTVSQSIGQSITIALTVRDQDGTVLKSPAA